MVIQRSLRFSVSYFLKKKKKEKKNEQTFLHLPACCSALQFSLRIYKTGDTLALQNIELIRHARGFFLNLSFLATGVFAPPDLTSRPEKEARNRGGSVSR